MPTNFTQPKQVSDVLKREWDKLHNRETMAATATIDVGTVITTTGIAYVGTGTVAGVALNAAVSGEQVEYLARGPAVVATQGLGVPSGNLAAALTALRALGITPRTAV